jgi:hypothetical protein
MTVITSGVPLKYDVISLSINDLLLPFTGITILTFTLFPLFIFHNPLKTDSFSPRIKQKVYFFLFIKRSPFRAQKRKQTASRISKPQAVIKRA